MLHFSEALAKKPKFYFTHGLLPRHIDPNQLPHAQKPFSVILQTAWVHTVTLVVPRELLSLTPSLFTSLPCPTYLTATFPLSALLSPGIYSFIKTTQPISLYARPAPGPDSPFYSVKHGVLHLYLPKELYERAGILGRPVPIPGTNAHVKRHFVVELDLRSPNMAKGKKMFERLRRAFEEVLTEDFQWIIYDPVRLVSPFSARTDPEADSDNETRITREKELLEALSEYSPRKRMITSEELNLGAINIPSMRPWSSMTWQCDEDEDDEAMAYLDWLGSVDIVSDRLASSDEIDPFLSRWQVPSGEYATVGDVVKVQWKGFISGEWVRDLLLALTQATRTTLDTWFALSAKELGLGPEIICDGYTILRTQMDEGKRIDDNSKPFRAEFLLWEMVDCINS